MSQDCHPRGADSLTPQGRKGSHDLEVQRCPAFGYSEMLRGPRQ